MDQSDLYDHEIKQIGIVWYDLQKKWSHKPNTRDNLQEFAKEANDVFLKMGFVVNVRWENNLVINPQTMNPYPIEIEFIGRAPGTMYTEDGVELFDHELKRAEVIKATQGGEKFLGEKGGKDLA